MNGIWSEFAEEGLKAPEICYDKFDFWTVDLYVKKYLDEGMSNEEIIEKIGIKNFNLYIMNCL